MLTLNFCLSSYCFVFTMAGTIKKFMKHIQFSSMSSSDRIRHNSQTGSFAAMSVAPPQGSRHEEEVQSTTTRIRVLKHDSQVALYTDLESEGGLQHPHAPTASAHFEKFIKILIPK